MIRIVRRPLARAAVLGACLVPSLAHALPLEQETLLGEWDAETQAALRSELATCYGCGLEALGDGSPNVVVPPDAHPSASVGAAPTPSTSTPSSTSTCAASTASLARSAEHLRRVGNSWFGAYYRASSASDTAYDATRAEQRFHAGVSNAVGVTAFGVNFDAARTEASADARSTGYRRLSGRLYARNRWGQMVQLDAASTSVNGLSSLTQIRSTAEFWRGDYSFTLGPVPLTVSGSLTGEAAYLVAGNTTSTAAYVAGTPTAGLYARASISASIGVAALGVDGQLTVAQGSLNTAAGMAKTSTAFRYDLTSDVQLNLLRGSIDAWVRVGFWRFKKTWRRNLVRWGGFNYSQALYNGNGQVPFCSSTLTLGTVDGSLALR